MCESWALRGGNTAGLAVVPRRAREYAARLGAVEPRLALPGGLGGVGRAGVASKDVPLEIDTFQDSGGSLGCNQERILINLPPPSDTAS